MNRPTIIRPSIIAGILAMGLLPCAALAQDTLRMCDVDIVYQPEPASYRPENTDYDLADQGKRFDIQCVIGDDGHMQDCQAAANNLADQNFVRVALDSVKKFVVGPATRDGQPTAGRILLITSEFHRVDGAKHPTEVAQAGS